MACFSLTTWDLTTRITKTQNRSCARLLSRLVFVLPVLLLMTSRGRFTALIIFAMVILPTFSFQKGQHQKIALAGRGDVMEVDAEVVWVAQISDLHFSVYHPDRARYFTALVGPLLSFIQPSLVLITGDLTDAKSKDRTSRRQDEAEWIEYSQAMHKVIQASGLPPHAFFDLRGNHDKFGVPEVRERLDYYSKYSINALTNRSNHIQSITLMNRGWKHLFVGMDTSMNIGLRGPCNLFGHPSDSLVDLLDSELRQWDSCMPEKVIKIVFGHFPLSFTASTPTGRRLEPVFAKHDISAYVCGHLHTTFGSNLIKHHLHTAGQLDRVLECKQELQTEYGEYWEWEMGDWRKSRMLRIIAIDQGHVSFTDFDVSGLNEFTSASSSKLPTLIVPTYPLDSQKMKRLKPHPLSPSNLDSVRALIFSSQALVSVMARFYDTHQETSMLIEELEMQASSKVTGNGSVYVATWNSSKYQDLSSTRYAYQIVTTDLTGEETKSTMRIFSLNEGRIGWLKQTWREILAIGVVWEDAFRVLLWCAFTSLLSGLLLSKMCYHTLVKTSVYKRWILSLFEANRRWKIKSWEPIKICVWFLVQGSADQATWWGMFLTLIYLVYFPWFWGQALAEGYPIGFMSIQGWTVRLGSNFPWHSGVGWPDIMVVVLPYLFLVIVPLYILIFALSAETVMHEHSGAGTAVKKVEADIIGNIEDSANAPSKKPQACRWLQMTLLGGCFWVAFVHFGQTCALVDAYGIMAIVASPGVAWPVPVLLIIAVLQATACRKRKFLLQ